MKTRAKLPSRPASAPSRKPRALSGVVAALMLGGCYYSPTATERLEESVVVTAQDQAATFGGFRSFFVRPEVRVLDQSGASSGGGYELLPDAVASPLVMATTSHLVERGYAEADEASADLGLELVYVRNLADDFYCTYWGDWAYWGLAGWSYYFPYSCGTTAWHAGMLVTHAFDLGAAREELAASAESGVIQGVWFSGVYGVELESVADTTERAVTGIDEAFEQSPYFGRQVVGVQ